MCVGVEYKFIVQQFCCLPSLISLTVSVDVKHHVYLLLLLTFCVDIHKEHKARLSCHRLSGRAVSLFCL